MNAIEIRNLTKRYKDFALEDVNLDLPEGGIMGLVGENGAGKSTTIKLIMNSVSRDSGTVTVLGTDNQSPGFHAVKEDIGVVLDEAYFPEVITAQNVDVIMKNTYKNWDSAVFEKYLKDFDLPKNLFFKDFSRGMKMKLAIAAALSHAPKLLVLDEATGGLDPIVRDEVLDVFADFAREPGHSVLLSSHIVSDLEKICGSIAFIHKGRLLFCEKKKTLLDEYAVVKTTEYGLGAIPDKAIRGRKETEDGVEALVERAAVPAGMETEKLNLEDIIVFLARGERK